MLLPNEQEGRGGECNLLRGCAEYTVMPNNYKTVPHITELFYCLKNWFEQYWVAVYFIVDVLSGKSEKGYCKILWFCNSLIFCMVKLVLQLNAIMQ